MLYRSLCLVGLIFAAGGPPAHAESLRARSAQAAPDRMAVALAPRPTHQQRADYPVPPVYDILAQSYPPPAPPRPGFATTPDLAADAALQPLVPPARGDDGLGNMIMDGVRNF